MRLGLQTAPVWVLLLACDGKTVDWCGNPCVLDDAHNFTYQSELQIRQYTRQSGQDLTFDWSDLSLGLQQNLIDPTQDIDELVLVVFSELSSEDVSDGLANDTLQQADVTTYMQCHPVEAETQCDLSDFGLLGSVPGMQDYFVEDSGTWLIALQSESFAGAQALIFLEPKDGATSEPIRIDDDSTEVDVSVNLSSLEPLGLMRDGQGSLDWSSLSVDGYGNSMAIHTLSELQIGRYEESLDEIAQQFVALDQLAEEVWTADIEGRTHVDLSELVGSRPFPGVDNQSRWLLALSCGSCDSPVPRVLMVLAPSD